MRVVLPAEALRSGASIAATGELTLNASAGTVSLGGSLAAGSAREGDLSDAAERELTLTLSGDVWEFRGVWAFESAAAELHWVTNAELHQLVLWYLIWGEAANLRLLPECLCLVLYCASNALQLPATVGWPVATLVDEAAAAADAAVHETAKPSTDAKLSHQSSFQQGAPRVSGFPEGDFLASLVTPIYVFLKREVRGRDAEAQAEP